MYMLVCMMDFVGFPVLWSLLQAYDHGQVTSQWQPLTLQGAGLFHIAMGAVIGISAYGRTQEKLNGAEGGGLGGFGPGVGTTYIPPNANANANINLGNPTNNNFGGQSNGFGSSTSGSSGFGSSTGGFGSPSSSGFGSPAASGFGGAAAAPAPSGFGSVPAASPAPTPTPAPVAGGFGSGFNCGSSASPAAQAPAPAPVTGQVIVGHKGKLGPVPADDPEI
jgi:hypothetical protein